MTECDQSVVLVDTTAAGQAGSMSRYGRLVAAGLARFAPAVRVRILRVGLPRAILRAIPPRLATWVQHGWLSSVGTRRVTQCRADVVHVLDGSYAYVARGADRSRLVVTCHDLIPFLQMTGRLSGALGRAAKSVVRASLAVVKGAGTVLADSAHTGNDLCMAGVASGRITVVFPPLDPVFTAGEQRERSDSRPARILHVGNDGFYKNRPGVLRVFDRIQRSADVELVLAGEQPGRDMRRYIAALSRPEAVRMCIRPTDAELRDLYRNASLLLFPSLYEGFGWPVLEAMACGCPVVCSNVASLPEVVGDAALMAAPDDTDRLAEHCLAILREPGVAETYRARGLVRAGEFTLAQMTAKVLAAYRATGLPM